MSPHNLVSASPLALFDYASAGLAICERERQLARQLELLLTEFAHTCTEYAVGIDTFDLVHHIQHSANHTEIYHDNWIRLVGYQFLQADGLGGFIHAPLSDDQTLGSMIDLARLLENIPHPITIYKTASGEYLILLEGTGGRDIYHDWAGAIESGLGLPGDYERHVMDFINDTLPAGATLHFAGHSQGGIVANNLADNQDFVDRFNVATVTTFGAPASARPNSDVVYTRYRNATDPVAMFDHELVLPFTRHKAVFEYMDQIPLDSGAEFVGAHGMSEYVKGLENAGVIGLPPGLTSGNLTEFASSDASRDSTVIEHILSSEFIPPFLGLVDVVGDTTRGYVMYRLNSKVDLIVEFLPESIADEIDRYRDRLNHFVMSLPNATQATAAFIDGALDLASGAVDFGGDLVERGVGVVDDVMDRGSEMVDDVMDFAGDVVDFGKKGLNPLSW